MVPKAFRPEDAKQIHDINGDIETQKELDIKHKWEQIFQEAKNTRMKEEYENRLWRYGISVLADKKYGDPKDPAVIKKKVELLTAVGLSPGFGKNMVENYLNSYDSEGNLSWKIVSELRYCSRAVERAMEEFAKAGIKYEEEGRSMIDQTMYTGFWTPQGFVDHARIRAEEYARRNKDPQ